MNISSQQPASGTWQCGRKEADGRKAPSTFPFHWHSSTVSTMQVCSHCTPNCKSCCILQLGVQCRGWIGRKKQWVSATWSEPQAASRLSHSGWWAACAAGRRGWEEVRFRLVIYWYSVLRFLPRLHWRDLGGSDFTRLKLQSDSLLAQCVYLPRTIFGVCS